MLKRKMKQCLTEWKNTANRKPLIIKECRQCRKPFSVLNFAKKNYKHVVYLNFFENPDYASAFSGSLEVDHIVMMLSALLGSAAVFKEGQTVLILDEIQDCPEARTALKFLRNDGRYDVIGTGSLLGMKGYGKEPKSIPVGSETVIDMYPLDFEEFLWANGVGEPVIEMLRKSLDTETPVPDAVQTFVDTKQMDEVLRIQQNIVRSYEDDMVKYAGSLQWIEDAGIISRCYNLSITEPPLEGNAEEDVFKVYMKDCGLFVSMLEDGTQYDILQGNLYGYKGAIFENLIADVFAKMGRKLYYFHKDSGLKVDFVTRYKGECTLIKVKASTGNTKSTRTLFCGTQKNIM